MATPILSTIALAVVFSASAQGRPDEPRREVTLTGRAVMLDSVLKERGIPADSEPASKQVVLKTEDGSIVPLLSSPASRALFLDERLRNRPIEIKGRRHEGLPFLEVVVFRVEEEGQFRLAEYWCDVCAIAVTYPQDCPCCQGPMELRYKPSP